MTTYQSQRVAAIIQHSTAQMSETAATSAGSYISRFNSGGKVFEDNGGMPMLPDQQQVQCMFTMLLQASAGVSAWLHRVHSCTGCHGAPDRAWEWLESLHTVWEWAARWIEAVIPYIGFCIVLKGISTCQAICIGQAWQIQIAMA